MISLVMRSCRPKGLRYRHYYHYDFGLWTLDQHKTTG
jgi:hypothetical protein